MYAAADTISSRIVLFGVEKIFVHFGIPGAHFSSVTAGSGDLNQRTLADPRAIARRLQPFLPALEQFRPVGEDAALRRLGGMDRASTFRKKLHCESRGTRRRRRLRVRNTYFCSKAAGVVPRNCAMRDTSSSVRYTKPFCSQQAVHPGWHSNRSPSAMNYYGSAGSRI